MKNPITADLLAAACHDLRGPLGGIGTWVHVLASGQADAATQARALAAMGRDVQAQEALIELLSELAALVRAEATPDLTPVDVGALLTTVAEARVKAGAVRLDAVAPGPTVRADPERLRRLLELLVTRALKVVPGSVVELRFERGSGGPELIVAAPGTPHALSVALARALAELQGGTLTDSVAQGYATLRLGLAAG